MPTPIVGYGNDFLFGTASDNTETDLFQLFGPNNTIYTPGGGNLDVVGGTLAPYGQDTATSIYIGDTYDSVAVNVALDGSKNTIAGNDGGGTYAYLSDSTVNIKVSGPPTGAGTGFNYVGLDNAGGSTHIVLNGAYNTVLLNDDATNFVAMGRGHATVNIGYPDDDTAYGYSTIVNLGGGHNSVTGGDANFKVKDPNKGGHNTVSLGEGNDAVSVLGLYNLIEVGGGSDQIVAGSGDDIVYLGGNDTEPSENEYYPPGNDTVQIYNMYNLVSQTSTGSNDANVSVTGGTGYNTVLLGNGMDAVSLGGSYNYVSLGYGNDYVNMPGDYNTITAGDGNDIVALGGGSDNSVTLGNGDDTVTGTGGDNTVTLGNGSDVITLSGAFESITAGNGNDTVTANGSGDTITLGSGNDNVTALGSDDTITINAAPYSHDNVNIGSNSLLTINSGIDNVTAQGNDTININGSQLGSNINLVAPNDDLFLADNASTNVNMALSGGNDMLTVTGSGSPGFDYSGTVNLLNFSLGDSIDLEGLGFNHFGGGPGGFLPMANSTHTGYVVDLNGGGQIDFTGAVAFNPSQFHFS